MGPTLFALGSLSAVTIDLDSSFFIQLVLVVFLLVVLKKLVFVPFLSSVDARQNRTLEVRQQAEALESRSRLLTESVERTLGEARASGSTARQAQRLESVREKELLVAEARAAAEASQDAARREIDADVIEARQTLKAEVTEISKLLARKVLGRSL